MAKAVPSQGQPGHCFPKAEGRRVHRRLLLARALLREESAEDQQGVLGEEDPTQSRARPTRQRHAEEEGLEGGAPVGVRTQTRRDR